MKHLVLTRPNLKTLAALLGFCALAGFLSPAHTYAAGPNTVVPDVVGMTQVDANTAIGDANLVVGTITYQYSNTVAAGLVISQTPIGGTVVTEGTSVDIVVSLGKSAVVPDVVGMAQVDANTAITDANLLVGTITYQYSSTVAAGLVISQSPVGGTVVNEGA